MVTVILSPHLDDAVLSCWHVLTQPNEVAVINVFAGVPANADGPAWWDRYTGATDSAQRARDRVEEDRRALALAGRGAVNLELLDDQYRHGEQPLAPVTARLKRLVAPGARVYAPAAFANHVDHVLVREAALELRAAGFAVCLYADLPHANLHGWPAWVTGRRVASTSDLAAVMWERLLTTIRVSSEDMTVTVHALAPRSLACKLEAVHAYRTQLEGLAELSGRPLGDRETLGYEVTWSLASASVAAAAPACAVPRGASPR